MSNKLVTSEYIYQNNASNIHSCIHGVCILYAFEYLTFRINGMVCYLSVCIEQNYIRTETLAVLPTGNLIFQLWACVIPIYIHFLVHTFASTTYSWDCLLHARGAADFFSRGHVWDKIFRQADGNPIILIDNEVKNLSKVTKLFILFTIFSSGRTCDSLLSRKIIPFRDNHLPSTRWSSR